MAPATVRELAASHGMRLPYSLTDDVGNTYDVEDERGWFRFQRTYDAARNCVRGEADMRRIVREAALADGAEGSRWLELQVDPTTYAPFVGGITPALEIVLDEAGAVSNSLAPPRSGSWSPPRGCVTRSRPAPWHVWLPGMPVKGRARWWPSGCRTTNVGG